MVDSVERIIIAEDDLLTGKMMKDFLERRSYEVELAENGQKALDIYTSRPSRIVLVDLDMPVMTGGELIPHLKGFSPEPMIIVTTSVTDPERIIDIMKLGVHDYLIKPVNLDDLKMKISRALETVDLLRIKNVVQQERVMKLEQQLEWFKLREKMTKGDGASTSENIFHYLNTSFNQGAGLGSIVPLVSMALMDAKQDGDNYTISISSDIYKLLQKNLLLSESALDRFKEIDILITRKMETRTVTAMDMYELVRNVVIQMDATLSIGGHSVSLSDPKKNFDICSFKVNERMMEKAIAELIVNACKFSKKNTPLTVIVDSTEDDFFISIINEPSKVKEGIIGVPLEYENVVFDPFFRMSSYVYEEYGTIDFGLGLTFVEQVVLKHGGSIRLHNINDFSDITSDPKVKVNAMIKLSGTNVHACDDD